MKGRVVRVLAVALAAVVFAGGCKKNVGTPEDNAVVETDEQEESEEQEELVVGFSCMNLSNPFYETLEAAIQTSLEEQGARLLVKNPSGDVQAQITQIQELIEEEVDAVILCPVDWEEITPALEALKEADIPVINLDTEVKETELVDAYIGSDNRNAGYVCGQDLIETKPDGGSVIIVECPAINSVNERITGFEEAVAEGGFEVLERINSSEQDIKTAMQEVLAENKQIDAVMCGNDEMALQVYETVKSAGRTDILIYGIDGSPAVKKLLAEGVNPMEGTGAQSPINIGKTAAETAKAIADGEDFEEEVHIETFFIDRENVEMYGTDGWQ
ncbi:substrate-binding domain-containing protein [Faecalicatena acetigenes]|uniref:Substrate-binding domain-containing protein n=1 Tax=Faecalicatena acetigenes TaxID=2981790 RepID=A0ABT2TEC1_9FIRM|nr:MULTISPECIES: substrate-binding domain-containing protein [Lachnospiraceae]MCU6748635.1 substrate-binding domain-containing protein [Faecalicatena acetigenes]SCI55295.1 D-ribose-binding periplasmic protein precursor [uncultured Clostridium sp.]